MYIRTHTAINTTIVHQAAVGQKDVTPSPLYQAIADPLLAHAVDSLLVHQPAPLQLAVLCYGHCYAFQSFPSPHPTSPLTLLLSLLSLPPNGRKNVNLIKRRSGGHWVVDSPPVVILRPPLGPLATCTEGPHPGLQERAVHSRRAELEASQKSENVGQTTERPEKSRGKKSQSVFSFVARPRCTSIQSQTGTFVAQC